MLSLGCKANARVFLSKTGHGPHPDFRSELLYVLLVLIVVVICNFGL